MRSTSWPLSILGAFASLAAASVDIEWTSDGTLRGQEILLYLIFGMITYSEGAWREVETSLFISRVHKRVVFSHEVSLLLYILGPVVSAFDFLVSPQTHPLHCSLLTRQTQIR